jgi:hypothetical protein
MRKRRRQSTPLESLRIAIDCMPVATREAMLRGVRANERILIGAYVDDRGGVCPMLAAHRCGGRTDFLAFAKSWDRFGRARREARAATERELAILIRQLESSLQSSTGLELDRAIAEHRALVSRGRHRRRRLPDQADPGGEITARRLRPRSRISAQTGKHGEPAVCGRRSPRAEQRPRALAAT